MEKSLFFDAQVQNGQPDRVYSAADLAALRRAYCDDGVLSADALKVSLGTGTTVKIAPGAAVVYGYTYILDTQKNLTLDAPSSLPRVDLVVLRLDLAARTIAPAVIKGEPAIAPATPSHLTSALKRDLPLAKIVFGASASASAPELTDLRRFASQSVLEAPLRGIVAEELEDLPLLSSPELVSVKALLSLIATDGTGSKVLCDDGQYRQAQVLERVELVRYTEPGQYEFSTALYPSANGLYDVEVIGAGGAGGSILRENARGGGGGAGAAVTVSAIRIPRESVAVSVGAGGNGFSGANGGHGGESVFGPVIADGGSGGMGGNNISSGNGGQSSPFYGEDGESGSFNITSVLDLVSCGAGGSGLFGKGGKGSEITEVSLGQHASGIGAGGSGAGGKEMMSSILAGGKGADGAVIVYGYRAAPTGKGVTTL